MRHFLTRFILVLLFIGVMSPAAVSRELVIAGTGDSQAILRKLAALFEKTNPGTRITVPDSVGSGGGIKAVIKGTAGLARTARALKPKEKGKDLTQFPFALSPIVFAAHPNVATIADITIQQAIGLYRGKIDNWGDLGGDNHKIYLVGRETGDSSRKVIDRYLTKVLGRSEGLGDAGKVFYTTGETAEAIARNRYTIGYLPFSMATEAELHIFSLDSVFPGEASVAENRYPLLTVFYLVRPANPDKLAEAFLSFVREEAAAKLMAASGVFPFDGPAP